MRSAELRHRRLAIASAVALALLLGVPGFQAAPNGVAQGGPLGGASANRPSSGAPNLQLLGHLVLANGSFLPGNRSSPNGWDPAALAYDSLEHRLFIGVAYPSPAILVLDARRGVLVDRWGLPGPPSAGPRSLAFVASGDHLFSADGTSGNVSMFDAASGALANTTFLGTNTLPVGVALDPVANVIGVAERGDNAVAFLNASTGALLGAVGVGPGPSAIAFDPASVTLVVANGGSSTVSVVYASNRTLGHSYPVGREPDSLAFDPAGGRLLVANLRSDNFTALNPFNFSTNASYGTGRQPTGLCVTTDGLAVIPNALDANVSIYDDTTGTALPSVAVGPDPVASVWNPSEGHIYVASAGNDSLTELYGVNGDAQGTIRLGASPVALAELGGGGRLASADAAEASVELLNVSNATVGSRVDLPGAPGSLAYDAGLGRLFATVGAGSGAPQNVSAIDVVAHRTVGLYPAGPGAGGAVFDPASGQLFVADAGAAKVVAMDPRDGSLNASFPIPPGPNHTTAVGVAVALGRLFVSAGSSNDSLAVLDASNGTPLASLRTGADPTAVAYDAGTGEVWVADTSGGALTIVDAANATVVGNLSVPGAPTGLAVDATNGLLYVADGPAGALLLVDVRNRSLVGTLPLGTDAVAVASDAGSGTVAVADAAAGDLALVGPPPPLYPVTFQEVGLPSSELPWTVVVDGIPGSSSTANLTLLESNGSHAFSVPAHPGAFPSPASGGFVMAGRALTIPIAFGAPSYNVTFIETGLPIGTPWWVRVDGWNVSGSTDQIVQPLPNGTYDFAAGTSALFRPTGAGAGGTVSVAGAPPIPLVVQFTPLPPYVVTFEETGLANGTNWSVVFDGTPVASTGPTIGIRVASGVYAYSIPPVAGERADPARGTVAVLGGSPAPIAVAFAVPPATEYSVTFQALGLPDGASFSVTLAGASATGTSSVSFQEPNGTYAFAVTSSGGAAGEPSRGNVTVAGRNVSVTLLFRAERTGVTPLWSVGGVPVLALALLAGLAAVVLMVVRFRRRRVRRVTGELVRSGPGPDAATEEAPQPPEEPPDEGE